MGHVFTKLGLVQEHDATLERSIWATIVALEEAAEISEGLSEDENGRDDAQFKREQAGRLKGVLERLKDKS